MSRFAKDDLKEMIAYSKDKNEEITRLCEGLEKYGEHLKDCNR
jgi:hypothetical protein